MFSCAARTWPTSIFKTFAPAQFVQVFDDHSKQLLTPESSTDDDDIPSLDTDISSSDPNSSTEVTLDDKWAYPPTPPPLPSLEIPQIAIQTLTSVPEDLELELPALDLPLQQFEDLQVDSNHTSKSGLEVAEKQPSNVQGDVEMKSTEAETHPPSTEPSILLGNGENIRAHYSTSLPPTETIGDTELPTEDDEAVVKANTT